MREPEPQRWYHLSLRTRVVLVSSALLVLAGTAGGLLTWKVTTDALRAEMIASGKRLVSAFAELNRLDFLDEVKGELNLEHRLRTLVQQDHGRTITGAFVLDRDGVPIAHSGRDAVRPPLDAIRDTMEWTAGGNLFVGTPVTFDQTTLGYVIFELNPAPIARAAEEILVRSASVTGGSLLINVLILLFLLRRLLRPLRDLGVAARELATGSYNRRIPPPLQRDEVGDAARSFNAMCDELETHLRFSNAALVDRIRHGEATDKGQEHQLSIVFGDAVGYTAWAQKHNPGQIFSALGRYYRVVGELMVRRFDGIIDKFMGDGVMAHFGLRRRQTAASFEHVSRALRATIYAQVALRMVARAHAEQGQAPLRFRFGIASGRCLVGAIGAENVMMDFSLIGNVVNLASRIETTAAPGGLAIDRFTRLDVGEDLIDARDQGAHEFKGFDNRIQLFSVRGFRSEQETSEMRRYLLEELFVGEVLERTLLFGDAHGAERQRILAAVRGEIDSEPFLPIA